jgi:hypothetical protein
MRLTTSTAPLAVATFETTDIQRKGNNMPTAKEKEANEIDLELDRLARRCRRHYEADGDARWQKAYMKIDGARSEVGTLMSAEDFKRTH